MPIFWPPCAPAGGCAAAMAATTTKDGTRNNPRFMLCSLKDGPFDWLQWLRAGTGTLRQDAGALAVSGSRLPTRGSRARRPRKRLQIMRAYAQPLVLPQLTHL